MPQDSSFITSDQLGKILAERDLVLEKRLGAIEALLADINSKMVRREGPIMDELHRFETEQADLRNAVQSAAAKIVDMVSRSEIGQIARDAVESGGQNTRNRADFTMRVVTFGVSLGTMIFVLRAS